jgi:hypothetical protein
LLRIPTAWHKTVSSNTIFCLEADGGYERIDYFLTWAAGKRGRFVALRVTPTIAQAFVTSYHNTRYQASSGV